MTREPPQFLVVGHLNKPHGTKGEFFVWPLTDRPEEVFLPGHEFRLGDESGNRPEIGLPEVTLESVRAFRRGFLVRFEGFDSRSQALFLTDRYLLFPYASLSPLGEDELHYHELLGMEVRTMDGEEIGEVQEVYELRPHHMLEVVSPSGTHLIPFNRLIVPRVDREAGILFVDPPEGLLDL